MKIIKDYGCKVDGYTNKNGVVRITTVKYFK